MQIRDIKVINLQFEYETDRRFHYAGGVCTGRLTSLVRVHTDAGLTGLGSVYSHPDLVRAVIEDHLSPFLIGENPLDIDAIWQRCYQLTRWYGRKGVALSAIGGLDIALWDLKGKVVGESVSELIGSRCNRVPAYASGLLWKRCAEELAAEARRHRNDGFQAMKMRLGRNRDYDREALTAVREAIAPDHRLMVDGNARYSLEEARSLVSRFQDARVFWLEEPFAPEDLTSFNDLRPALGGIPLAAGENEFGLQGFAELMDSGAVQIVQPDCCRCGGITEACRIVRRARELGLSFAPHTWSDAVALVANMHLVASHPHGLTVEMDRTGNPFIDELLTEPFEIRDGLVTVPDGSGLGIGLDEDFVARHEIPRGAPIPPGNYSDMVFQ